MLSPRELELAARILVHRHGRAAAARAGERCRTLLLEAQPAAALLWAQLRDYLAKAQADGAHWERLEAQAHPDAIHQLSGQPDDAGDKAKTGAPATPEPPSRWGGSNANGVGGL